MRVGIKATEGLVRVAKIRACLGARVVNVNGCYWNLEQIIVLF